MFEISQVVGQELITQEKATGLGWTFEEARGGVSRARTRNGKIAAAAVTQQ